MHRKKDRVIPSYPQVLEANILMGSREDYLLDQGGREIFRSLAFVIRR